MKLSALLVVRNEESIVEAALRSVRDFDEIVVVDTGSTDSTKSIAETFEKVKVYTDFTWCDDFAAARNHAIEKATGDWLYSIDADHELLSPVEQVRAEAQRAEAAGVKVAKVKSLAGNHMHWREVLFKNDPAVRWTGKVHEGLPYTAFTTSVERRIGHSGNHRLDPDRNLRILEASPDTPRTRFYFGRELFERRRFKEAITAMQRYLEVGRNLPEIAEANLVIARCHWSLQQGDEARAACLEAVRQNPDFAEALRFMGTLYYEPHKSKWNRLADAATNEDVLFIRT